MKFALILSAIFLSFIGGPVAFKAIVVALLIYIAARLK